ncbi:MAG TPA: hypothetical protein VKF17_19240, partial [Isosphaeraceae bacterium]|nr:hypothetical protein [Isosphaeraceae bacterium]
WAVLYAVVAEHVGRLKQLLAHNQVIEAAADPTWADRAALDCSPAFERHRRYQSAKTRELLRTLETLQRMRKAEFGTGNGEVGMGKSECGMGNKEGEMADGECQMANDKCQMTDGGGPIADDEWLMAEGGLSMAEGELPMADEPCEVGASGCDEGQSSEPMAVGSSGPVVGHNCDAVIDDSTNDKIGLLSHEGTDPTDRPGRSAGVRQSLPCGVKTPQKAPNEAKLELTQALE